jgi:hypothetical protein
VDWVKERWMIHWLFSHWPFYLHPYKGRCLIFVILVSFGSLKNSQSNNYLSKYLEKFRFKDLLIPSISKIAKNHWVSQFFTKNSFKSKLKTIGKLGVFLVLLESPHWVGFNEGDLEIFRPNVDKILNFEFFFWHWKFN